jgi:LuxR family transcriptional regulator, maltose regulon positive regulatory protein
MQRFPAAKLRAPRTALAPTSRDRLHARLDAARATCRVTVVSAPAGYGKTTLVASWAERQAPRAAWYSVDPGDDPGERDAVAADRRVASWLAAAVTAAASGDPAAHGLLAAADAASMGSVTELAAALEGATPPWRGVLVIDDAQLLGAATAGALATWIERAPEGTHTVVAARRTPRLPLARWLARGDAELPGAEDLRMTPGEGAATLTNLLPELPPELATALVARVEGWPAGLALAARSLRGRSDPSHFIERFTGTDRYVLAFLTEEVLLRLPDDLHEAALLLAGEPRLCAGLVDALTGTSGGAAILERLAEREAFLERLDERGDDDGPWYRFPGFFRDLLAHRLERSHPDLPATLAERARRWRQERSAPAVAPAAVHHAAAPEPGLEALTRRELEVLRLLVAGTSVKASAKALGVSPNTVKTHTRHLFEKLGVSSRLEAAARARDLGLL